MLTATERIARACRALGVGTAPEVEVRGLAVDGARLWIAYQLGAPWASGPLGASPDDAVERLANKLTDTVGAEIARRLESASADLCAADAMVRALAGGCDVSDADHKALLAAAIDALARAADACAAAGVDVAGWNVPAGSDLAALLKTRAEESLALLTAAEQTIAIGDTVRVVDRLGRERTERLDAIGRRYIRTDRSRYDIEDGRGDDKSGWGKIVHPHDLARIKRWLDKSTRGAKCSR